MIIIYNIIQLIALVFLAPLLVVFALLTPRYRHWLWRRLGWGVSLQEGARGKGPRTRDLYDCLNRETLKKDDIGDVNTSPIPY